MLSRLAKSLAGSISIHGALFAAAIELGSSPMDFGIASSQVALEVTWAAKKSTPRPTARPQLKGIPVLAKSERETAAEEAPRNAEDDGGTQQSGISAWSDAQPSYLSNPAPLYPALSRRLREEGVVHLVVEVTAEGTVRSIAVSRSSGYPRLDEAALRSVRTWQFQPARARGVSVESRVEIPIRFRISDS